jgi:hypothetical protein
MRLALLVLAISTGTALADPRLAGEYQGIIWSAGSDSPGKTVLKVRPNGAINGNYVYDDMGSPARGKLTDCALAAPILRCTWQDAYGSGALILRFSDDFKGFEGSWYDYSLPKPHDHPEKGYRWTGTRRGA